MSIEAHDPWVSQFAVVIKNEVAVEVIEIEIEGTIEKWQPYPVKAILQIILSLKEPSSLHLGISFTKYL